MMNKLKRKVQVMFLGPANCGKTSIIKSAMDIPFSERREVTIFYDFFVSKGCYFGHEYEIFLWDTAGQERYAEVTTVLYRRVDGIILVLSPDIKDWKTDLHKCLDRIEMYAPIETPILGLINKSDLMDKNIQKTRFEIMDYMCDLEKFSGTANISAKNNNVQITNDEILKMNTDSNPVSNIIHEFVISKVISKNKINYVHNPKNTVKYEMKCEKHKRKCCY